MSVAKTSIDTWNNAIDIAYEKGKYLPTLDYAIRNDTYGWTSDTDPNITFKAYYYDQDGVYSCPKYEMKIFQMVEKMGKTDQEITYRVGDSGYYNR